PAAAGPSLLLPRHADLPPRRTELLPTADQPATLPRQRHVPRRNAPIGSAFGRGTVQAQFARRRQPLLRDRRTCVGRPSAEGGGIGQAAPVPRIVRGSFQPGSDVLAESVGDRTAASGRCLHLRTRQMLRGDDPETSAPRARSRRSRTMWTGGAGSGPRAPAGFFTGRG